MPLNRGSASPASRIWALRAAPNEQFSLSLIGPYDCPRLLKRAAREPDHLKVNIGDQT